MNEANISMHPAFGFEPDPSQVAEGELEPIGTKGEWQARAALGELLILSFSTPARPLTITVTLGEYATAVKNIASDLGLNLADGFDEAIDEYEGMRDGEMLEKLEKEYKRLFGDESSDGILSRYESDWREAGAPPAETIEAQVAEAYRSCGLMATPGQGDPLDHLEAEIEFLEFAALAQVGMVDTNPEAPVGADGYGDAYRRFIAEHASKWMPRFADAVIAETDVAFYRAAALLLKAYAA